MNSKIKIGIDGRILDWKYSGIARYVQSLLKFHCFRNAKIFFPCKSSLCFENQTKVIINQPFRRRELYEQLVLPWELKKEKIDLFIQPYNFGIPLAFFGKSILIVFDIIPLLFKNYFFYAKFKGWARWNYLVNTKIAISKATKIICDSQSARQDLLTFFPKLNSQKTEVIHYGFEKIFLTENGSIDKLKKEKGIRKKFILVNAGLEERKNIHILIEAYARLPESLRCDLVLVVTGYNKVYLEKLKQLISKTGIDEKEICFTDSINEEEKNLLIKEAELIVNPSAYEGFGIPLLEAASFGKPIIVSDISAFHEVGGEYPLYFSSGNVFDLTKKILFFFSNQKSLSAVAAEEAKKILPKFSMKKMENEWERVINE